MSEAPDFSESTMTVRERLIAVLQAEAEAISSVYVTEAHEQAAIRLASCAGKVITTGIGKAGIIAAKCAATLCATGTPAVFLHPGEAAHGDLGVVSSEDMVLAYSTSGQTTEVLEVLDAARAMGVPVIGITSHPGTEFRGRCDLVLDMGLIQEPCPLGLTPTASSAVMLAIGDALALAVMELKGITRADFGRRHRSGYLGAQASRG